MNCPPAQVNLSQFMQMNQQVAQMAIAQFFQQLMGSQQKSPLHAAAVQNMGQNNFQNQVWNTWVQIVVDLVETYMRSTQQPMQPQQAVQQAVMVVFQGYLGSVYMANQMAFQGQLPAPMLQQLQQAAATLQNAQQQIQIMKQQTSGQIQQYQQPMGNNVSGLAVGGYQGTGYALPDPWAATTSNPGAGRQEISPAYDTPGSDKPLVPTQEWSTDQNNVGGAYATNTPPPQGQQQMQTALDAPIDPSKPVPLDVTEVKVDPFYYQAPGFTPNVERPFDVIWNPGGVEIRPAHLAKGWKRTVGDEALYSPAADPKVYCHFLVKWPDGTIKETFIKWIPMMDYLRHELDDELKRQAYRPNGVVVAVDFAVADITEATTTPMAEIEEGKRFTQASNPLVLDGVFQGGSDTQIERDVLIELRAKLALSKTDTVPAHEYLSEFQEEIALSKETAVTINEIGKYTSFGMAAGDLKALVQQGKLSVRAFRQLDKRLTDEVCSVVRDSLSIKTANGKPIIESFCEDIVDLIAHITKKYGSDISAKLVAATPALLGRTLSVLEQYDEEDTEQTEPRFFLANFYVNFQMPWVLADISTQNINNEPALLSAQSSPVLAKLILEMWNRAKERGLLPRYRLRLITLDGVYIDIIRGMLVERAILLKVSK